MDLNPNKCHTMYFSKSRFPLVCSYEISNTILINMSAARDLGVLLDNALSFKLHISETVFRALKIVNFVKRCTILLYCSVWNPLYACPVHQLEQVQRKFLRYLAIKAGLDAPLQLRCALQEIFSLLFRFVDGAGTCRISTKFLMVLLIVQIYSTLLVWQFPDVSSTFV